MNNKKEQENIAAVEFQSAFSYITPSDLDEIMECLEDMGYLTKSGKDFKHLFWKTFIKRDD
jgi:hypothetical protein